MRVSNTSSQDTQSLAVNILLAGLLLVAVGSSAFAVAPTREAAEQWRKDGIYDQRMAEYRAFKASGGCQPSEHSPLRKLRDASNVSAAATPDTIKLPVLLVYFSNNPAGGLVTTTTTQFDSMLFGDPAIIGGPINPTGSMTQYYLENSYGTVYVTGKTYGWFQMPQNYNYYLGTDLGLAKSQEFARDAIVAANGAGVDFSLYAPPGGTIPGVIIVHAGRGGEESGVNGIRSHKFNLSQPFMVDGVYAYEYTVNPEEFQSAPTVMAPIGVFTHELGHVLGLPDLYDSDGPEESDGLGDWSLMAFGNYNRDARKPAHMDAWCKIRLGWLTPTVVTANLRQVAIPQVETNPVAFLIPENTTYQEYWLVENRQIFGFDEGLPGYGLLIYHIDSTRFTDQTPNDNHLRYAVALEQADGLNDLALTAGEGDNGDPWPGATNNRAFHDLSTPNSRSYAAPSIATQVGVWNISDPGPIMYADLDYSYSRPWLLLTGSDSVRIDDATTGGNGDGWIDNGETVNFHCRLKNLMRFAARWSMRLETSNPYLQFLTNDVAQGDSYLNPSSPSVVSGFPIRMSLPTNAPSRIDSFRLIISADTSITPSGDRFYRDTFYFEMAVGTPRVLVVDDDNGKTSTANNVAALRRLRVPHRIWTKQSQGSPSAGALNAYEHVFWAMGFKDSSGTITLADIAALKGFLDNGGNLCLASYGAGFQIATLDPAFLSNYLRAAWTASTDFNFLWRGIEGGQVGQDSMFFRLGSAVFPNGTALGYITPVNGSQQEFVYFLNSDLGGAAISYSGAYKVFFASFPIEFISDVDQMLDPPFQPKDTIILRILNFFNGTTTAIGDDPNRALPGTFLLEQNYPNPFNPTTTIAYTLEPSRGGRAVRLTIHNLLGQTVRALVEETQPAGRYQVIWDGRNQQGAGVASGVYFYRLAVEGRAESRKMILLK